MLFIEELNFQEIYNGEFDDSEIWSSLKKNCKNVPNKKGIYVVVDNSSNNPKEKIVYIGQAGGNVSSNTIKERVRAYVMESNSHKGGKKVRDLKNKENLIVYWKVLDEDPSKIESELLREFIIRYGDLPLANMEYKRYKKNGPIERE